MVSRRTLRRPPAGSFDNKPYDTELFSQLGPAWFVQLPPIGGSSSPHSLVNLTYHSLVGQIHHSLVEQTHDMLADQAQRSLWTKRHALVEQTQHAC